MTDIDFDELDKAVSSLMNQHNQNNQSDDQSAPGVSDSQPQTSTQPNVNQDIQPKAPSLATEPASVSQPEPKPTQTIVKRPSGRFMDVVHPSSDMRSGANQQVAPSAKPSRQAATLQPIAANDSLAVEAAPEVSVSQSADSADTSEVNSGFSGADMDSFEPKNDIIDDVVDDSQKPMQSPFLTEVEVDKRPLGGASLVGDETQPEAEVSEPVVDDFAALDPLAGWQPPEEPTSEVDQTPETQPLETENTPQSEVEEVQPLAPELAADVVALESDVAMAAKENESTGQSQPTNTDVQPAVQGRGDIPQQYSPEDTDGPEPSAIFDAAAEEPQSLQHPEKKKSGWMVVVWVLLLIIIGAGLGVAAWYFLLK